MQHDCEYAFNFRVNYQQQYLEFPLSRVMFLGGVQMEQPILVEHSKFRLIMNKGSLVPKWVGIRSFQQISHATCMRSNTASE